MCLDAPEGVAVLGVAPAFAGDANREDVDPARVRSHEQRHGRLAQRSQGDASALGRAGGCSAGACLACSRSGLRCPSPICRRRGGWWSGASLGKGSPG
eukprot:13701225-Alexandrium_andersonii.AAC.1